MALPMPRYSKEEFARRGEEIYQQQIRAQMEPGNKGKIVAIDIETGEYEVGPDVLTATDHLLARLPDAQIWCLRIGYPAVHRIGGRPVRRPEAPTCGPGARPPPLLLRSKTRLPRVRTPAIPARLASPLTNLAHTQEGV